MEVEEVEAMTTEVRSSRQARRSGRAGLVTLVLGSLFAAAVLFTYVLSISDAFNPPDWVRVIGLVWLPIGVVGIPTAYDLARQGEGRTQARVGVVVALVGLVALIALVVALG
jgi:hypothetical protein